MRTTVCVRLYHFDDRSTRWLRRTFLMPVVYAMLRVLRESEYLRRASDPKKFPADAEQLGDRQGVTGCAADTGLLRRLVDGSGLLAQRRDQRPPCGLLHRSPRRRPPVEHLADSRGTERDCGEGTSRASRSGPGSASSKRTKTAGGGLNTGSWGPRDQASYPCLSRDHVFAKSLMQTSRARPRQA